MDKVNISNMLALWHCYGSQIQKNNDMHYSNGWPYKCWFDEAHVVTSNELFHAFEYLSETNTNHHLVAWSEDHLKSISKNVSLNEKSRLIAMNATLASSLSTFSADVVLDSAYQLRELANEEKIPAWVNCCSEGFGYKIDTQPIVNAFNDDKIQLLGLYEAGTHDADNPDMLGTALTLLEDNNLGFHQITTSPNHRGKGLGKFIMQALILYGKEQGVNTLTLQASPSGFPLYEKLGFTSSFPIISFRPD